MTRREDVKYWASGNAYQWVDAARSDAAKKLGIPPPDHSPRDGDIVVWENAANNGGKKCGVANETYGHVAYVTKVAGPNVIVVDEANWITNDYPEGDGQVHPDQTYPVDSTCMWFIHRSVAASSASDTTPITPTPQVPPDLLSWLRQIICGLVRICQ